MIYIVIFYLIGYIISYYFGRFLAKSFSNGHYGWVDVVFLSIYSIFSWITLLMLFIIYLFKNADSIKSKPPRWL